MIPEVHVCTNEKASLLLYSTLNYPGDKEILSRNRGSCHRNRKLTVKDAARETVLYYVVDYYVLT